MSRFTVILDACTLYPAPLRDTLMRLALTDLFKAHWSADIHKEWINALLRQEGKFTLEKLEQTRNLMDMHVKDALVTGYEYIIDSLELPDPDDRHVLAAAIRCNADAIVTLNLKDFPENVLAQHGIEAIHPDDFIYYQLDLDAPRCCAALKDQREALKHPKISKEEFLNVLQKQQLPKTVSRLRTLSDFL
jgi:predicted nucleic acid-binding protein